MLRSGALDVPLLGNEPFGDTGSDDSAWLDARAEAADDDGGDVTDMDHVRAYLEAYIRGQTFVLDVPDRRLRITRRVFFGRWYASVFYAVLWGDILLAYFEDADCFNAHATHDVARPGCGTTSPLVFAAECMAVSVFLADLALQYYCIRGGLLFTKWFRPRVGAVAAMGAGLALRAAGVHTLQVRCAALRRCAAVWCGAVLCALQARVPRGEHSP